MSKRLSSPFKTRRRKPSAATATGMLSAVFSSAMRATELALKQVSSAPAKARKPVGKAQAKAARSPAATPTNYG